MDFAVYEVTCSLSRFEGSISSCYYLSWLSSDCIQHVKGRCTCACAVSERSIVALVMPRSSHLVMLLLELWLYIMLIQLLVRYISCLHRLLRVSSLLYGIMECTTSVLSVFYIATLLDVVRLVIDDSYTTNLSPLCLYILKNTDFLN